MTNELHTTKATSHHHESTAQESQLLLNKMVLEWMRERKHKRYWRWLRFILFIILLFVSYKTSFFMHDDTKNKPHVGLVDIRGTIFDTDANSDDFARGLDAAYGSSKLQALILRINSPGGSPVQADDMYRTINYYRHRYPHIKTYAVCVDICTSAAYYVAAATDKIYANRSSLVGSIGVLYNGFGFVDTMQKLGITRRLQTAGLHKAFLDPFSSENPEQKAFLQIVLNEVHQQFINQVKKGRGSRLKISDEIFSGLSWTGQQAKTLGLIDGFASAGELTRRINKNQLLIDYTYKQSFFERVTKSIGTAIAHQLPLALGLKTGLEE